MIIDLQEDKCVVTYSDGSRNFTKAVDTQKLINALSLDQPKSYDLLPHNTRYISNWQGKLYVAVERSRHKSDMTIAGTSLGKITIPATLFIFVLEAKSNGFEVETSYAFAINDSQITYDYTDFLIPHLPGVKESGEIDWSKRMTGTPRLFVSDLNDLDNLVDNFLKSDIISEHVDLPPAVETNQVFTEFEGNENINFKWLKSPTFNDEIKTLVQNVFDPRSRKPSKLAFVKKVSK